MSPHSWGDFYMVSDCQTLGSCGQPSPTGDRYSAANALHQAYDEDDQGMVETLSDEMVLSTPTCGNKTPLHVALFAAHTSSQAALATVDPASEEAAMNPPFLNSIMLGHPAALSDEDLPSTREVTGTHTGFSTNQPSALEGGDKVKEALVYQAAENLHKGQPMISIPNLAIVFYKNKPDWPAAAILVGADSSTPALFAQNAGKAVQDPEFEDFPQEAPADTYKALLPEALVGKTESQSSPFKALAPKSECPALASIIDAEFLGASNLPIDGSRLLIGVDVLPPTSVLETHGTNFQAVRDATIQISATTQAAEINTANRGSPPSVKAALATSQGQIHATVLPSAASLQSLALCPANQEPLTDEAECTGGIYISGTKSGQHGASVSNLGGRTQSDASSAFTDTHDGQPVIFADPDALADDQVISEFLLSLSEDEVGSKHEQLHVFSDFSMDKYAPESEAYIQSGHASPCSLDATSAYIQFGSIKALITTSSPTCKSLGSTAVFTTIQVGDTIQCSHHNDAMCIQLGLNRQNLHHTQAPNLLEPTSNADGKPHSLSSTSATSLDMLAFREFYLLLQQIITCLAALQVALLCAGISSGLSPQPLSSQLLIFSRLRGRITEVQAQANHDDVVIQDVVVEACTKLTTKQMQIFYLMKSTLDPG